MSQARRLSAVDYKGGTGGEGRLVTGEVKHRSEISSGFPTRLRAMWEVLRHGGKDNARVH